MNLLLDTHAFIWFLNGDSQLHKNSKRLITETSNQCFISMASIWEIAIKTSIKKLELAGDFNQMADFLHENQIDILPITFEHIQKLLSLPFHHRDPFDRIIIAQAFVDGLTIITRDTFFNDYGITSIWK